MADRVKRSVSMPPDVDARVVAAAAAEGLTYSAWLAREADRALRIMEGRAAVVEWELQNGALTPQERAQARRMLTASLDDSDMGGAA